MSGLVRVAQGTLLLTLASAANAGNFTLSVINAVITVDAVDMPRSAVMQELAQRTGLKVRGVENLDGLVSGHFSLLGVRAAIQRLAGENSYTLVSLGELSAADPSQMQVSFIQRTAAQSKAEMLKPEMGKSSTVVVDGIIEQTAGATVGYAIPARTPGSNAEGLQSLPSNSVVMRPED